MRFFNQLTQAAVDPNVISFNAAISSCEKAEQWQQALFLFQTMRNAKIQPNVISYNAAISSCQKGGQWLQALCLFHAMPEASLAADYYHLQLSYQLLCKVWTMGTSLELVSNDAGDCAA